MSRTQVRVDEFLIRMVNCTGSPRCAVVGFTSAESAISESAQSPPAELAGRVKAVAGGVVAGLVLSIVGCSSVPVGLGVTPTAGCDGPAEGLAVAVQA